MCVEIETARNGILGGKTLLLRTIYTEGKNHHFHPLDELLNGCLKDRRQANRCGFRRYPITISAFERGMEKEYTCKIYVHPANMLNLLYGRLTLRQQYFPG